jgi:hypothetical protein
MLQNGVHNMNEHKKDAKQRSRTSPSTNRRLLIQDLPPLSDDDYSALKADIAERGVQVAIEYDEDGNIIDGHARENICKELGISDWPRVVRAYPDDAAKRTQARKLNLARRHLDRAAKQALIEAELKDRPERSNRQVAAELGVDDKTVGAVRERLVEIAEIPQSDRVERKGGGTYPSRKPTVARIYLPGDDGKAAIKKAYRQRRADEAQELKIERERQHAQAITDMPTRGERYDLIHADFMDADIEAGSIDAIVCDPPYAKEFLENGNFAKLSERASVWLKPGGSLMCMVGNYHLPQIMNELGSHLSYQWTLTYLAQGREAVQAWQRKVHSRHKTILWYVKGNYTGPLIDDVIRSDLPDRQFHDHGQSLIGMAAPIAKVSKPGDTILDPFCGGGTTGVAALLLDRRFIGCDIDEKALTSTAGRLKEVAENGLQDDNFEEWQRAHAANERLIGHVHFLCDDDDEWSQIAEAAEAADRDASWIRESVARRWTMIVAARQSRDRAA